ncbi:DNA cytosine methyltransferase [Micrococcus sp. HOU01]|uniref:DNA cytosine methyltransferase n=1 Tax=Micrococcus sp. HOU01 TaxID=3101753 RepID=UPI002D78A7CA|nr:DNA (cytosine-5-)-methyltransferase [Micrococcus sp. HOU1]WRQ42656.1 DNA (cytosine-5-)-methyltransferase [Micrococcus sp. HOU1]
MALTSIEVCAGAGGQALGLETAGFKHLACVEYDANACTTLRTNRPQWNTIQMDLNKWSGADYAGQVDLFAGGVPCPPFSKAGKQLGEADERNLFPRALDLIEEISPRAVMLENVRGLLDPQFQGFRDGVDERLKSMGYVPSWRLLNASDFGVSQLRPRVILVALKQPWADHFTWPEPDKKPAPSVGQLLGPLMAANGWEGAQAWADGADRIAPTLVGGSHKHGGPDLGPTRARAAWAKLGVEGRTIGNAAPEPGFVGMPRITVQMGGMVQGFPADWQFTGGKTHGWRQVGNAFPPPVAAAVGKQIKKALRAVKVV